MALFGCKITNKSEEYQILFGFSLSRLETPTFKPANFQFIQSFENLCRESCGMLGRTIQNQPLLSNEETNALFEVVTNYTYALDTLDNYDYERLTIDKTTKQESFHTTYENADGGYQWLSELLMPCMGVRDVK